MLFVTYVLSLNKKKRKGTRSSIFSNYLAPYAGIPLKLRVFRLYINRLYTPKEAAARGLKEAVSMKNDHHPTKSMKYPSQWYKKNFKLSKGKYKN